MDSNDNTVGKSSLSRESLLLAPVQEIRSRGFQLFDEQPIVRQLHPNSRGAVSGWEMGIL